MNPWTLIAIPVLDLLKRLLVRKDPERIRDRKPVDLKSPRPRLKKPNQTPPKDPQ